MKKLVLNEKESLELLKYGVVEIIRNGFEILIELNIEDDDYKIKIINPYDKVVVKNDEFEYIIESEVK